MKPIVFYVDDEPHNLTVFEAALPEEWDIHIFDNPLKAIEAYDEIKPTVVVSDQRMPGMNGVQYLELTKKLVPRAVRILVTGYSDEDLVVESVRKAQIFDYIRKPWEVDDLETSLNRAIEFYNSEERAIILTEALKQREKELQEKNRDLFKATVELEKSKRAEVDMRKELECWVPPFVLWSVKDEMKFPIHHDLHVIAFDIINSSKYHDKEVNGRPLRSLILQTFSEKVIHHGGWRESHSGDSAYAHFGLIENIGDPAEAALAVAREFRVAIRSINQVHGTDLEVGIGLHIARNCKVDVHSVHINTPQGVVVQKSFDTTSRDIDLVHRIETVAHELPGTNIIMTEDFRSSLSSPPDSVGLGYQLFKGQPEAVKVSVNKSDLVKEEHIAPILARSIGSTSSSSAA